MLRCQEAAVHADVLQRTEASEMGVEFFTHTAASVRNAKLRYDYNAYASPWSATKETPETAAVRESFSRQKPWAWHAKRRLAAIQERSADIGDAGKVRRSKKTPTIKAKRAPKRTASKP